MEDGCLTVTDINSVAALSAPSRRFGGLKVLDMSGDVDDDDEGGAQVPPPGNNFTKPEGLGLELRGLNEGGEGEDDDDDVLKLLVRLILLVLESSSLVPEEVSFSLDESLL